MGVRYVPPLAGYIPGGLRILMGLCVGYMICSQL
jgi:hypothetical protein